MSVVPVLVYTADLIALFSEELNHLIPSERIIPVLGLGACLGTYYTILLLKYSLST